VQLFGPRTDYVGAYSKTQPGPGDLVNPVTVLKKPLKVEQLNQTVNILGHKTPKLDS
jgi:hypothetical protein